MKKPTTPIEKPTPKAKTDQVVVAVASEAKTKKPSSIPKTPKQPPAVTPKPVSKAKAEPVVAEESPKKPSPAPKSPKKSQVVVSKPAVTKIASSERIGLTAGSIWHYLADNGATPVTKLVRELPEDEKTIQRSIGWLAQEGKITLDTLDRVETIGLTG